MQKLSIIIPSYNRPIKLLATLKLLILQIVDEVIIIILDNCSPQNYEEYCRENDSSLQRYIENGVIKFNRNTCNIGMSANFLRAFEICETEWMWLLSDDDDVSETAIATIMNEIELISSCPSHDVALIKFNSKGKCNVEHNFTIKSLDELIDILAISSDWFNSYIFISNSVYRMPHFKNHIGIGYLSAHTYVPHLIMILDYVNKCQYKNVIYCSERNIVSYLKPEVGYSYGIVAGLGVGAFKNFTYNISKKQYTKLENSFAAHNDFKVIIDLHYFGKSCANNFVVKKLVSNYYVQIKQSRGLVQKTALRICMLFLYFPRCFEIAVSILSLLSNKLKSHVEEIKSKYRKGSVF